MKNTLFTLLLLSIFLIGCKESETAKPSDNIVYEQINKTVTYPEKDTVRGACRKLIFLIVDSTPNGFHAVLKENTGIMECSAFNSFLTDSLSSNMLVLDENVPVPPGGNWQGTGSGLILDNYAGKGQKFIGYRAYSYPDGVLAYRYGWIKVSLSAMHDTLRVISRATNNTYNQPIFTGQTK